MTDLIKWAKQYAADRKWEYFISWIEILGVIMFVIGISALLGHIFERPHLYKWTDDDPGMAIPSTVVSTLGGLAVYLIGLTLKKHAKTL